MSWLLKPDDSQAFALLVFHINRMSESILRRSKLICYFQIDDCIKVEVPELMRPQTLPISLFHFHYSALYFPALYKHFKAYLPTTVTPNHLRLKHNGRQLPVDLPIGLFVENNATISVTYVELPCPDGFKLMMISWKKGYTIVNKEGGCDHVFKKLNLESQMELYKLHLKGSSHGLHTIPKYEGNAIAVRIIIQGTVIERKEDRLKMTIAEYLQNLFGETVLASRQTEVLTHNVKVDLDMPLKQLLQEWNYNDGYCYLKIQSID